MVLFYMDDNVQHFMMEKLANESIQEFDFASPNNSLNIDQSQWHRQELPNMSIHSNIAANSYQLSALFQKFDQSSHFSTHEMSRAIYKFTYLFML